MSPHLLATKFHIPPRRVDLVARPRLLQELQRGLDEHRKLTLISAPAGYGKTTLVAEWLSNLQSETQNPKSRISWLSLDEVDNAPRRFLHYFLAAFQLVDESLGALVQGMLAMPDLPLLPRLLDDLLNELAETEAPLVLVLDDYHVISSPEIHAALEYFLDHQPASVHLILTTRADPSLPLARLRARRQMTELRARDLRFSVGEARAFFGLANLPLAENALRALDERTEGWAAGLQLAALALQHQPDPAAFIETFRGSHRYVLDYLAGEVLHQQGEEMRVFLTQTSLLARFNAELCNALTGRDDSQALIARLEQSNLFIIPLDDERLWYRYHHLFADYLRSLLSKAEQTALYQKAAAWHEANDLTAEAVRYALACDNCDFAAQVIENALEKNSTWSDGNLTQLVAWLEALPGEAFQSRPRLSLHAARAFYVQGRFTQAEVHLAQAEQFLQALPVTRDSEQLLAIGNLHRGAIASVRGEFQKVFDLVPVARTRIPPENHLAHARAFFSLGIAHENAGHAEQAVENYLRSSAEARAAGVLFLAVSGLCSAAQVQIQQGCLRLAENSCREAIQLTGGTRIPPLGLAWGTLGALALERNNLSSAEKYLQDGIALSRQGGLRADLVIELFSLGRLYAYQGNLAGIQAVMDEALSVIRSVDIPRSEQLAYACIARYQHFLGQPEAAAHWASEYQSRRAEAPDDFADLTLARILLASGQLEPVAGILRPLLEKAEACGRGQTVIETMMLLGLFHHARGEAAAALEWLEKALKLAAPEGYLRLFLDEGRLLFGLLSRVRHAAPELVDAILNGKPAQTESRSTLLEGLPYPLSEQEIRVLKLIVAGKSNAEIAAELVISVGTAKWHVHNVLQKLGAGNRPQAIARARELGI
jgi:LuxR family maltose regulon positive regulatory protein